MSTQSGAPDGIRSRFSRPVGWVRDLPIWTKLGLIMIVPTLATIVVGTAALLGQVQQASLVERARSLTVLSGDAGGLVNQLQNERALAVQLLMAKKPADVEALSAAFKKQAAATETVNGKYRLDRTTIADVPDNIRDLLGRIETELGELPVMRTQMTGDAKPPLSIAEQRYVVVIADLLSIRDLSSQLTGDATLTDRLHAASGVALAKEYVSQERVVVMGALLGDQGFPQNVRHDYIRTMTGRDLALGTFSAVATPEQKQLYNTTVTGPEVQQAAVFEGLLDSIPEGTDPSTRVSAAAWDKAMVGRGDKMNTVEVALNAQALQTAVDLGARVQRQVLVETGLLLVTLLLGVLFAWLVARSMARALRDLRQGALAVAQYGLPQAVARLRDPALSAHISPAGVALQIAEPLPVRSRDEFGQVTEAFNAVHLEAVRTAAEQAALRSSVATMFVNLARRSQILVDRLIGHLDRLERGEQDPDRLSELFQLDHLATRMRRNDENLLVLAGADSTRVQREPAALMDVLRAAQSEVEHYTRIEFSGIDHDIEIAAHAVNDLVHLVAELFDNATAFSPPDTSIVVEARRSGDRAVLHVEDRGIGMSPDQYAELNERLSTPPMVDVAVSRMMGLVVVARLAARHGVRVELHPAQTRGTVAVVQLPSGVLVPRALAGRTHAPAGFPAARSPEVAQSPPGRPVFPAPLALESGSPGGWGTREDFRGAPPHGPAFNPPPSPFGAPPVPAYGGPAGGAGGLGAALAGGDYGYGGQGGYGAAQGGPGNGAGRPVPAWYDFTGASQAPPDQGTFAHGARQAPQESPLPQRRPGTWGEPEDGPQVPRQPGSPDAGFGGGGGFGAAAAGFAGAAGGFAAGGGWAGPAGGGPAVSNFPQPGSFGGGAPAPSRPPVWPPVVGDPGGDAGDGVPGIPERLSASLDMTSEMPRTRGADSSARFRTAEPLAPPSRYADDLTMELPIFRELESAWFNPEPSRSDAYPGGSAPASGAGWSDGSGGTNEGWATDTAMAGTTRAASGGPYRSERGTGSDGAWGAGEGVSWRTVADDGWLAAQAAMEPEDGGTTEMGLPRRVPMAQLVPGGVESPGARDTSGGPPDRRTPDSVRGLLSAYHRGVQRGRGALGADGDEDTLQTRGKEQEA